MIATVREIVGHADDPALAGRQREYLVITWAAATKRRLRAQTDAGTEIALDLPRGTYLAEGLVLDDDGSRVVCVQRAREPALVVAPDATLTAADVVELAARVGHAFGNQHVPIDVVGGEIRVPLTTSERVARATVDRLGLPTGAVRVDVREVALARTTPMSLGAGHAHPTPLDHAAGHRNPAHEHRRA